MPFNYSIHATRNVIRTVLALFRIYLHTIHLYTSFYFPGLVPLSLSSFFPCFERVKTAKCTAAGNNRERERERERAWGRKMEFSTTLRYRSNGLSIDSNDRRFNCVPFPFFPIFLTSSFVESRFFSVVTWPCNLQRPTRSLFVLSDVIGEFNACPGKIRNIIVLAAITDAVREIWRLRERIHASMPRIFVP